MDDKNRKKDIFSVMAGNLIDKILACPVEMVDISEEERRKMDPSGNVAGELERYIRISVEIPRGCGELSKIRFDVKIPDGKIKLDVARLEEEPIFVTFNGLEVTYVDPRRTVYFRAKDYDVLEEAVI